MAHKKKIHLFIKAHSFSFPKQNHYPPPSSPIKRRKIRNGQCLQSAPANEILKDKRTKMFKL